MELRKLKTDDAKLILEWMKDPELNQFFRFNPLEITLKSVNLFIENSLIPSENKHYAISENGEYLGTVSIKNIKNKSCEFAIGLRKKAIGKGVGTFATREILGTAFEKLMLDEVKLFVLKSNRRAIKMYVKNGFILRESRDITLKNKAEQLCVYSITRSDYETL